MKILLIDYDAGTVSLGGDTHAYDLAKEWKKSGGKVLIAAADYSYLRQKNPEKPQTGKIEEQDGVPFLWIKSPAAADREKKILRGTLPLKRAFSAAWGLFPTGSQMWFCSPPAIFWAATEQRKSPKNWISLFCLMSDGFIRSICRRY